MVHPLINDHREFLIYSSDPWPEVDSSKWRGAKLTVMDTGERYIFLDGWQPHPEQIYEVLHSK